jgi:hydroxypyruvate isomerase
MSCLCVCVCVCARRERVPKVPTAPFIFFVCQGADATIKDCQDKTAADVADKDEITALLLEKAATQKALTKALMAACKEGRLDDTRKALDQVCVYVCTLYSLPPHILSVSTNPELLTPPCMSGRCSRCQRQ